MEVQNGRISNSNLSNTAILHFHDRRKSRYPLQPSSASKLFQPTLNQTVTRIHGGTLKGKGKPHSAQLKIGGISTHNHEASTALHEEIKPK